MHRHVMASKSSTMCIMAQVEPPGDAGGRLKGSGLPVHGWYQLQVKFIAIHGCQFHLLFKTAPNLLVLLDITMYQFIVFFLWCKDKWRKRDSSPKPYDTLSRSLSAKLADTFHSQISSFICNRQSNQKLSVKNMQVHQ